MHFYLNTDEEENVKELGEHQAPSWHRERPRRQCAVPRQPESFEPTLETGMEMLILNHELSPDMTFPPTWQPGSGMGQ